MAVLRRVCSQPIWCEHCGHIQEEFVEYIDGCSWCSACAYANMLIEMDQMRIDQEENKEKYKEFLQKELDNLKEKGV